MQDGQAIVKIIFDGTIDTDPIAPYCSWTLLLLLLLLTLLRYPIALGAGRVTNGVPDFRVADSMKLAFLTFDAGYRIAAHNQSLMDLLMTKMSFCSLTFTRCPDVVKDFV